MRLTTLLLTFLPLISAQSSSAPPPIPTSISGYTYAGCFNETTLQPGAPRALTMGVQVDPKWESQDDMTTEMCITFCGGNATQYAGLEYSKECWCGKFLSQDSAKLPDSYCNSTCAGNSSEACGQSEIIQLYNRTAAAGGAWVERARGSVVYAGVTALLLGLGTLVL